jgi:hypothetical protein
VFQVLTGITKKPPRESLEAVAWLRSIKEL